MDNKIRILVVGDVCGKFKQLFQRVESINKKSGPFEILLCVGDFFATNTNNDELIAYRNGNKNIPVPTYILGPNNEAQVQHYENLKDGEICSNLTYLGKRGVYTLSSGVKIAYLSGVEGTDGNLEYCFTKKDVMVLRNNCLVSKSTGNDYKGVDILITSQWPYGHTKENKNASKLISVLSRDIKPHYHFCALNGTHLEPPPHRIPADEITHMELSTRFIALAPVGNEAKEKYIYALNLTAVDKVRVLELIQKTTNEIKCPYINLKLENIAPNVDKSENKQYFYDMSGSNDYKRGNNMQQNQRYNKRPKYTNNIDQEICWFCLSSENVEKHLVISIGESFYLALAKGPINKYHVLILSITHIPSSAHLSESDWKELEKFKNSLKEFFKSENQAVCFTERNYKTAHLQINVLGIEEGYAWKIKHAFEDKAEEYNLPFEALPVLDSPSLLPKGPFFVAELADGSTLITRQMKQFPLHFARDVFCSENLLNCDEKVDWNDCKLSKEEEIEMVKEFRKKFAPFDCTL